MVTSLDSSDNRQIVLVWCSLCTIFQQFLRFFRKNLKNYENEGKSRKISDSWTKIEAEIRKSLWDTYLQGFARNPWQRWHVTAYVWWEICVSCFRLSRGLLSCYRCHSSPDSTLVTHYKLIIEAGEFILVCMKIKMSSRHRKRCEKSMVFDRVGFLSSIESLHSSLISISFLS